MKNKKYLAIFTVIGLGVAILSQTAIPAFAATKIGTITVRDGDVKDLLKINAEITKINNRQVTFNDLDTGKEYTAGIGPVWYSGTPTIGSKLTIEGVEAIGEKAKAKGNTFLITKLGDKILRANFPGKPAWAGKGSKGQGRGMNQAKGRNFVDANNNGICDNAEKN